MKVELAKTVKEELAAVSSLSLTTDIWTSMSNDAYISITASYITNDWKFINRTLDNKPMEERHTQDNISASLKTSAEEWGIADKVNAVVHDGAANMNDTANSNGWKDVNCSAHILHLIVTSSMGINKVTNNPISKCIGAASHLVGHFSHSPLASNELVNRQKAMNIVGDNGLPLKLVQHVKTRWNSVYDMFEHLHKLRWPVVAVLSDRNFVKAADAKTLDLKEEYWQLIEDLLPVLQPLQIASELLCADKMPSASVVYPIINKLIAIDLTTKAGDSPVIKAFKDNVRQSLDQRFEVSNLETASHPFLVATVLDPATKQMELFSEEFRQAAYSHVRTTTQQSSLLAPPSPAAASTADANVPPPKRSKLDLRAATLKFLSSNTVAPRSPAALEFDRYMAALVNTNQDALQWWANNASQYPECAALARVYLSVPATSVLSERQFSEAGRLISKLRSRLNSDRVDTLIFLYANM
jgi:hAT family C-terminal dimerisation region